MTPRQRTNGGLRNGKEIARRSINFDHEYPGTHEHIQGSGNEGSQQLPTCQESQRRYPNIGECQSNIDLDNNNEASRKDNELRRVASYPQCIQAPGEPNSSKHVPTSHHTRNDPPCNDRYVDKCTGRIETVPEYTRRDAKSTYAQQEREILLKKECNPMSRVLVDSNPTYVHRTPRTATSERMKPSSVSTPSTDTSASSPAHSGTTSKYSDSPRENSPNALGHAHNVPPIPAYKDIGESYPRIRQGKATAVSRLSVKRSKSSPNRTSSTREPSQNRIKPDHDHNTHQASHYTVNKSTPSYTTDQNTSNTDTLNVAKPDDVTTNSDCNTTAIANHVPWITASTQQPDYRVLDRAQRMVSYNSQTSQVSNASTRYLGNDDLASASHAKCQDSALHTDATRNVNHSYNNTPKFPKHIDHSTYAGGTHRTVQHDDTENAYSNASMSTSGAHTTSDQYNSESLHHNNASEPGAVDMSFYDNHNNANTLHHDSNENGKHRERTTYDAASAYDNSAARYDTATSYDISPDTYNSVVAATTANQYNPSYNYDIIDPYNDNKYIGYTSHHAESRSRAHLQVKCSEAAECVAIRDQQLDCNTKVVGSGRDPEVSVNTGNEDDATGQDWLDDGFNGYDLGEVDGSSSANTLELKQPADRVPADNSLKREHSRKTTGHVNPPTPELPPRPLHYRKHVTAGQNSNQETRGLYAPSTAPQTTTTRYAPLTFTASAGVLRRNHSEKNRRVPITHRYSLQPTSTTAIAYTAATNQGIRDKGGKPSKRDRRRTDMQIVEQDASDRKPVNRDILHSKPPIGESPNRERLDNEKESGERKSPDRDEHQYRRQQQQEPLARDVGIRTVAQGTLAPCNQYLLALDLHKACSSYRMVNNA